MHSQKLSISNRTVDTLYPQEEGRRIPIAIEPYGAVTTLGKAYRTQKEKKDLYKLFDQWSNGREPDDENDKNYVMAVLVRGGVFGQSEKE